MSKYFETDLQPTHLFRLVVKSNDPRLRLEVGVDSKRPIDSDYVPRSAKVESAFDFREPDLPAKMRVYANCRILGLIPLEVRASSLGESSWHLQFLLRNRLCGTGRVDIVELAGSPDSASEISTFLEATGRERRVVLRLSSVEHIGQFEGVTVATTGWSSLGGGWLGPQSGGWISLPDGLHLLAGRSSKKVAVCRGLIVATTAIGAQGNSLYPENAGTGKWEVMDVSDFDPRSF